MCMYVLTSVFAYVYTCGLYMYVYIKALPLKWLAWLGFTD